MADLSYMIEERKKTATPAKKEGHWKGWIKPSLKEVTQGVAGTPETLFSLMNSMALWPIQKVAGASRILSGDTAEEARDTERQIGEAFGFQPRTRTGKGAGEIIGKGFDVALTPARMAGEGMTGLVGPRAGYLTELASELAMFKMAHKIGGKAKEVAKERSASKSMFNKKMSELTKEQRHSVHELAKQQVTKDLVKKEREATKPELEKAYETQKDIWIGNKDIRVHDASVESRLLKKEIVTTNKKLKTKISNPKVDEAIQLYIDTKRDPSHIKKYYDQLPPEKQKIVDLSQDLPSEIKAIADKIEQSYKDIGTEAVDAAVLKNMLDDYTSRRWDFQGKKGMGGGRKFGTTTGHAKMRKFKTIIEAWADPEFKYELKYKGATDNLRMYKEEMVKTIEDKRFVDILKKQKDLEGNPLLTTKHLEGYERVEHPNFKAWEWSGEVGSKKILLYRRGHKEGRWWSSDKEYADIFGKDRKLQTREIDANKLSILDSRKREGKFLDNLSEKEMDRALTERGYDGFLGEGERGEPIYYFPEKQAKNLTLRQKPSPKPKGTAKIYGKNFFKTDDGQLMERRELYAPKKQAKNLNNILGISRLYDIPGVKGITKFNDIAKAWILQTSLYHHQAFARSYYLGTNKKRLGEMNLNQARKAGMKAIEQGDPTLRLGVETGLTLGVKQDWNEASLRETTFVGRILNKSDITKKTKDGVNAFREGQAEWLFGELGAGLKAKSFLIEMREQMKKYPNENPRVTAARVSRLINNDFGGLHLQRLGRNPTLQHILKLVLLAPDWSESNFRTVVKTVRKLHGDQRDIYLARRFWGGVVVKGLGVTALANFVTAGGDFEQLRDNYKQAWKDGNFNWAKWNVTPIYHAFGGDPNKRKYFSIMGHFLDPPKATRHPGKTLKYKQSVVAGSGFEFFSGTDWKGAKFTTLAELLEGEGTVKWGKGTTVDWDQFPSYALSQIIGSQPIQLQNFVGYTTGEIDGFDALTRSIGLMTTSTYPKKTKDSGYAKYKEYKK